MPGYRNNIFSYCLDGAAAVYVLGLGLAFTLILGSFLGTVIVEHFVYGSLVFFAVFWLTGVPMGLFQLWGFLSYMIIAFEVIALFRIESHRWLILLTILLIQICETARALLDLQDKSPWLQALSIFGVVAFPILSLALYHYLEREPTTDETPYSDCRSCGYNLTGTLLARGTSCPECGEPITPYQQAQSLIDQRKFDKRPPQ